MKVYKQDPDNAGDPGPLRCREWTLLKTQVKVPQVVLYRGIRMAFFNHGLVKWLPASHLIYGICSHSRCFSGGLLSFSEENREEATGEVKEY